MTVILLASKNSIHFDSLSRKVKFNHWSGLSKDHPAKKGIFFYFIGIVNWPVTILWKNNPGRNFPLDHSVYNMYSLKKFKVLSAKEGKMFTFIYGISELVYTSFNQFKQRRISYIIPPPHICKMLTTLYTERN